MCVLFASTAWAFVALIQVPALPPFANSAHTDTVFGEPALHSRWEVAHHKLCDVPVGFGEAGGLEATAVGPVGQERGEDNQFHDLGWIQASLFDAADRQSCRFLEEPTVGSQFVTCSHQFKPIGPSHSITLDIRKLPPIQSIGRALVVSVAFHVACVPSDRRLVSHCPDCGQEIKLFLVRADKSLCIR